MGVTLHTGDMSMDDLLRYAQETERLGYEGFWLTEESGKEAFAVLALLAQATERLRLCTGILNYYSRTPTLLAMGASTIHRLSGGRMVLGLGPGGVGFTGRGHGLQMEAPLARARETLDIVRGLLTQRRFSYEGRWFHVQDFHLREGPIDGTIPLYLSALNPKMVQVAAKYADGFISNWLTEESLAELQALVKDAAESVGRDPKEVKILTLLMATPDPDNAASVDAMRQGLAFYCASKHYHHIADISGYGDQARRVYDEWQTRDFRAAARLVSDAMVEKFSLTGSPDACRRKLRWLTDAGVYPIVYPVPRRDRMVEDHFVAIERVASYAR